MTKSMADGKRSWRQASLILVTFLLTGCVPSLSQPTSIPAPLSTSAPAVKPSSIPTWTPTSTSSPTPIPTATAIPTKTPIPTPTDTPVPPTATPTPIMVAGRPPEDWPYRVIVVIKKGYYDSHHERWSACFHECDTASDFVSCANECPTLYFFTGTHYVRAFFYGMGEGSEGAWVQLSSLLETYNGERIVLVELPSGAIIPTINFHVFEVE